MKKYKDDEIKTGLAKIWADIGAIEKHDYDYRDFEIEVEQNEKDVVRVKISRMYDAPALNLTILKAISEFFGTDIIDDDRFSIGGCESCDWGSEYGFTLTIKACK